MRRIVLWVSSTATVLVLLLGYHTSTEGAPGSGVPAAISTSTSTEATGAAGASAHARAGRSAAAGSGAGSGSGSGSASGSGTAASRTVSGDVVGTPYGPVQVQLTVAGSRITDVAVPQYPTGSSTDAQINGYALPTLARETIQAQSAHIDMVSGATFTSHGYLSSLQSALDRAGL